MANVLIESQTMTDIANAIREKNGTDTTYKPAEMSQAVREIASIESGDPYAKFNEILLYDGRTNYDYAFAYSKVQYDDIKNAKDLIKKYCTKISNGFKDCSTIKKVDLDISNVTNAQYCFIGCINLIEIYLSNTNKNKSFISIFNYCIETKTIEILDFSSSTNNLNAFLYCYALENIKIVPKTIKKIISFEHSDKLTDESIQSIIDGLADLTGQTAQTITFHTTVKNKLTEEQIASATSKNWNIA